MEIGVRWVFQQVKDKHGIVLEAGQKPALCFKARKFMLCVASGHPVRVLKRPAIDMDKCRVVLFEKQEYTIARAVDQFLKIGRRNGITEGAKRLLARAAEMVEGLELNEDDFTDEEDVSMKLTSEKSAGDVTTDLTGSGEGGDTAGSTTNSTTDQENTTVATKAKRARKSAKKDKPAKPAKAKSTAAPKAAKKNAAPKTKGVRKPYIPSPDSKIGKAVAFMRAEIKEAGGIAKQERGYLKDLFERTAKKCGVAYATAQTQYNAQIRHKPS